MKLKKSEKKKVSVSTEAEPKEEKLQKIKTDMFMKVGRIVLWVVILFLLLRGIASILMPSSEIRMEQMITDYRADAKLRETIQVGAATFAEDFAHEYYTFSGRLNSDYEQRLKRYTAKNLEVKSPGSGQYGTEVILARAENIDYQSGSELDVDVHLQVAYLPLSEGGEKLKKDVYIKVPLAINKKGQYAVTSFPIYIPQTGAGKIASVDTYQGLQVENSEVDKIKETLNSFFSVYFGGTKNELSYYLTEDSAVEEAAAGMVSYERTDYATVCKEEGTGDYLVDTKFSVSDNGISIVQRAFLRMEYIKGRYYIKSITTRPV